MRIVIRVVLLLLLALPAAAQPPTADELAAKLPANFTLRGWQVQVGQYQSVLSCDGVLVRAIPKVCPNERQVFVFWHITATRGRQVARYFGSVSREPKPIYYWIPDANGVPQRTLVGPSRQNYVRRLLD